MNGWGLLFLSGGLLLVLAGLALFKIIGVLLGA